jgi:hypothetical protein
MKMNMGTDVTLVQYCENSMIKYTIENDLGMFSANHKYNPDIEPNADYVEWALGIRNLIDISLACSDLDGQTGDAIQRQCS